MTKAKVIKKAVEKVEHVTPDPVVVEKVKKQVVTKHVTKAPVDDTAFLLSELRLRFDVLKAYGNKVDEMIAVLDEIAKLEKAGK